jgi:hypothetical protein
VEPVPAIANAATAAVAAVSTSSGHDVLLRRPRADEPFFAFTASASAAASVEASAERAGSEGRRAAGPRRAMGSTPGRMCTGGPSPRRRKSLCGPPAPSTNPPCEANHDDTGGIYVNPCHRHRMRVARTWAKFLR